MRFSVRLATRLLAAFSWFSSTTFAPAQAAVVTFDYKGIAATHGTGAWLGSMELPKTVSSCNPTYVASRCYFDRVFPDFNGVAMSAVFNGKPALFGLDDISCIEAGQTPTKLPLPTSMPLPASMPLPTSMPLPAGGSGLSASLRRRIRR